MPAVRTVFGWDLVARRRSGPALQQPCGAHPEQGEGKAGQRLAEDQPERDRRSPWRTRAICAIRLPKMVKSPNRPLVTPALAVIVVGLPVAAPGKHRIIHR